MLSRCFVDCIAAARDRRTKRVACPILAAGWVSDSLIAVGGGGGKAKSGIPNRVMLCGFSR